MAKRPKPRRGNKGIGVGGIVLISVLVVFATIGILLSTGMFSATGGQKLIDEEGNPIPLATCDSTTTPSVLLTGYDSYNKGTAIVESFIYREVGKNTWSNGALGTAVTDMSVGKTYEIVFGVNTSQGIDKAYGGKMTYTVPCSENPSEEVALYNDELEGSLVATFYNNDDNAGAETFIAGQTQDVRIKFQAGTDEVFGNPNEDMPNVLILKLNSSEWDKPEKVYLADGTELKSVSVPQRYDVESLGAVTYTEYAYEAPVITDVAVNIYMKLNADDTNAPSIDGTAYLYAGDYFIQDNAEIGFGVEDEEGADVATSDSDSVTLDFTA